MAEITGIDVSMYQKGFNFQYALNEGFSYFILRAGSADKGTPYKDPQFDTFYKQLKALKIENIGAYFYGRAFSVNDAIKEANFFMSCIQGTNIVKVYYDVEGKMLNQDKNTLTMIVKTFCDTINNAGYVCGVYSSESHFNSIINDSELKKYPHWVAKYSKIAPVLKSGIECEIWQYGGTTNYIRSNKINGTIVDQNYIKIPWTTKVPSKKEVTPVTPQDVSYDTIHQIALDVLSGKYGSGEQRKKALGDLYDPVQAEVNAIINQRANKAVEKTTEQLANEVLAGLWGSGITRKMKLGSRYNEVQAMVNQMANARTESGFLYTVVKGDNLTKIAKKYNTTVQKLMEVNDIKNPNQITVGQVIKIK